MNACLGAIIHSLKGGPLPLSMAAMPVDEESHASWTNRVVFNGHGWHWSHGGTF
jgi:hypothetical protein